MRILFAGTPEIAVPTLRALSEHFEVGAVLTNTDKPGARGRALVPSAVKSEALRLGLAVLQHDSLGLQARTEVAETGCDTLVCFAYGRMFGPKFLSLFSNEKLNIHPSLLPSLRGPSPIQGAILNQMTESGISIQRIAREMDSGDILACERFVLQGDETAESLFPSSASRLLIWRYEPLAWCRQELQRLPSRKGRLPTPRCSPLRWPILIFIAVQRNFTHKFVPSTRGRRPVRCTTDRTL